MLGKYDEAIDNEQKGVEINLETGAPLDTPQLERVLAVIQLDAGDIEIALSSAEDALKLSREYRSKTLEAFALLYLGRIEGLVDPSRIDAGLMRLRQCISTFDEMGARTMASLGYMFLGEVYEKAGLREEALENLQKADEMYGDLGVSPSSYFITRTREALARLS
jgi:tetratricopeptide (TPR) repeat protein